MSEPVASRRTVSVVADDLTGANDSVVQFRQAGWTAYLLLGEDPSAEVTGRGGPVALSRSLDTRPLPNEQAAAITRRAVAQQLAAGIDRLYLKIDSTMRGSVAGQVAGALEAWSSKHPEALAVVCPAYPQMGRVITDGHLFVNGVPLEQSPAGTDPVTPVTTSDLRVLVPGARHVAGAASAAELAERLAAGGRGPVLVDAAEDADLRRLAEAVQQLGGRALCAGSAGLARHLATVWLGDAAPAPATGDLVAGPGRLVVFITSLNEVSRDQARHLADALAERLASHEVSPEALGDKADMRQRGARLLADSSAPVLLLQPTSERLDTGDRGAAARTVAQGLAAAVAGMVATGEVAGLVLVGGDGAEATLEALKAEALRLEGQVREGVPVSRIVGGPAAGLAVATKAGGFGEPRTLIDVVSTLLGTKEDVR